MHIMYRLQIQDFVIFDSCSFAGMNISIHSCFSLVKVQHDEHQRHLTCLDFGPQGHQR